jgi:hypothetical protein
VLSHRGFHYVQLAVVVLVFVGAAVVAVTAAGRGVAVVFMVTGVALFGLLTATLSSYFVESGKDSIGTRIDGLRQQLDDVQALLATVVAQADAATGAAAHGGAEDHCGPGQLS